MNDERNANRAAAMLAFVLGVLGLVLSTVTCLAGCQRGPVPPEPSPFPDAGTDDDPETLDAAAYPSTCAGWCRNARRLGCGAGKDSPGTSCDGGGCSCTLVCENLQSSGIVAWDLRCRAHAKTCHAADACEKGR